MSVFEKVCSPTKVRGRSDRLCEFLGIVRRSDRAHRFPIRGIGNTKQKPIVTRLPVKRSDRSDRSALSSKSSHLARTMLGLGGTTMEILGPAPDRPSKHSRNPTSDRLTFEV
jgi:hypothetical protein